MLRVAESETVIAIAHRLSTIARMDWIVTLDAGRIAKHGSHAGPRGGACDGAARSLKIIEDESIWIQRATGISHALRPITHPATSAP
jgi:hypothetical protein